MTPTQAQLHEYPPRKGWQFAYHFLHADMRSQNGSEEAWNTGEERTIDGPISLCERGYHSSPTPWDAVKYGDGLMLCLVEVSREDGYHSDGSKSVSRSRKLLKAVNVERELRIIACRIAKKALMRERKQGREPDPRSWEAIRVVRLYADGKATRSQLSAAWSAAWSVAWSVAWSAVESAARSAAWSAARIAARSAEGKRHAQLANKILLAALKEGPRSHGAPI